MNSAFQMASRIFSRQPDRNKSAFVDGPLRAQLQHSDIETPQERGRHFESLRAEHRAQKCVDLSRINPSWITRALQDEPRSVQEAILLGLPGAMQSIVAKDLGISQEVRHPLARRTGRAHAFALSLATSKLVGDVSERPGDSPAIVAFSKLDSQSLSRLIRVVGLVKWSVTRRPFDAADLKEVQKFADWFESLKPWNSSFAEVALSDLNRLSPDHPGMLPRLGLIGFSRILSLAEPHRARWAMQHLPYSTAKTVRSRMVEAATLNSAIIDDEHRAIRASWLYLFSENQIGLKWQWE